MFNDLKPMLSKADADYADLRYEIKKEVKIGFNGKELTHISANSTDGYVLRILKNGGLSSIAFTKKSDSEKAFKTAEENAHLISKNLNKPIKFTKTEVVKGSFLPKIKEDPRYISIDEKYELTKKYNGLPLNSPKIATTNMVYQEIIRDKYYINTDGSEINEDLVTTKIHGYIVSKNGSLVQNVRVGVGGSNGFAILRNREEEFEHKTRIVLQLLNAKPVKAGVYNVILNQGLAGLFTHEAFGHFSEADLIEDHPSIRRKMKINARLGNDIVTIIDDPTRSNQLGFYQYDDEGIKAQPTLLLKNGVLVGRLHSRRTASAFDEPLNGHCVAEDYRYAPIVRMGTIFIQPGENNLDELAMNLKDGLYLLDAKGGQTSGENFTFGAQYGYIIKDGKICEMIRDINISGNLYKTLMNISAVGNDLVLSQIGGCGKGQINIRSCHGAPHILIKNVIIGGV